MNSQSSHPSPKISGGTAHAGVVSGGHTLSLVSGAGSLPIRKSTYRFGGGGIFTSPIRNCLSVCLCIRSTCDTMRGGGGTDLPQTQTESDSARDQLRESRDSAHDCQSRLPVPRVTFPPYTRGCSYHLHCARNGRRLCLGHTQYTLSRTLSRDETSLQPAQPVCSADDGCLVVSCHFINHRRPLRGARRPHGGE